MVLRPTASELVDFPLAARRRFASHAGASHAPEPCIRRHSVCASILPTLRFGPGGAQASPVRRGPCPVAARHAPRCCCGTRRAALARPPLRFAARPHGARLRLGLRSGHSTARRFGYAARRARGPPRPRFARPACPALRPPAFGGALRAATGPPARLRKTLSRAASPAVKQQQRQQQQQRQKQKQGCAGSGHRGCAGSRHRGVPRGVPVAGRGCADLRQKVCRWPVQNKVPTHY